ncbi:hypothetical protein ABZ318_11725 [Streptomyces sp. NPDC006197]|uniref:hypothetical protein n=1 Tax=Streptomyces sp. NPDC006197 TaxID=3156685 RepID=UPI00339FB3EC
MRPRGHRGDCAGGAGQPLGRTLYAPLARHTSTAIRAVALIVLGGLTTAVPALTSGPYGCVIRS